MLNTVFTRNLSTVSWKMFLVESLSYHWTVRTSVRRGLFSYTSEISHLRLMSEPEWPSRCMRVSACSPAYCLQVITAYSRHKLSKERREDQLEVQAWRSSCPRSPHVAHAHLTPALLSSSDYSTSMIAVDSYPSLVFDVRQLYSPVS
jgi:hypothetical protein